MLEWIAASSVLILIVLVLRALLKGKISLRLQYALWALVLIRLLVPVSFGSARYSVNSAVQPAAERSGAVTSQIVGYIAAPPREKPEAAPIPAQPAAAPEGRALTLLDILKAVWLTGAALVGLCFLAVNLHFYRALASSRRRLEYPGCLRVYVTAAAGSPCLFGLVCPAIYMPPQAAEDADILRHAAEHETSHFRHGDHVWSLLRGVCLALHWYNPLVWLAAFCSRQDAELACDEATVARLGESERAAYGRTLIGMSCKKRSGLLNAATTMTSRGSGLRERIVLLARKPRAAAGTLLILTLILAFAVGCTFMGAPEDVPPQPSESAPVSPAAEGGFSPVSVQLYQLLSSQSPPEPITDREQVDELWKTCENFEFEGTTQEFTRENVWSVTAVFSDGEGEKRTYTIHEGGLCVAEDEYDTLNILKNGEAVFEQFLEAYENAPRRAPSSLLNEPEANSVCAAIQPTGETQSGDEFCYVALREQEVLKELWARATASAQSGKGWLEGEKPTGLRVVYKGEWWEFTDSGAMVGAGRIEGDDAAELYTLCRTAVYEAGFGEAVRPEDIHGVRAATLNGAIRVTDEADLARIEDWLSNSELLYGGAACWFTSMLTLELEQGGSLNIAMATDSCGIWMSNGLYYYYADGNEELFSIFAPAEIHEAAKAGMDELLPLLAYLDWSRYAHAYGPDDMFALMELLGDWASEDADESERISRFMTVMSCTRGLDGAYTDAYSSILGMLYELDKAQFAWCCLGNLGEAQADTVLHLLAYELEISKAEARALLESQLP